MRDQSSSRGFALPMAILVVALLTISATSAFVIASSEERETANTRDQMDAFALAQSGLERFLLSRRSLGFNSTPPAPFERVRIDLPGGYADVTLERVRPSVAGSPVLYVIRSLGVRTDPSLPGTPFAQHTVARYARWQGGSLAIRSAFTSLTGLHKNGASGNMKGDDQCGVAPDVAGVSVATPPGYTQTGGGSVPSGTPDIEDMGTYQEAADETFIDWQGIVSGTALTPDVRIPPQSFPGALAFANPAYWPVILVDNAGGLPFSLSSYGQGILIVTGNLIMNGGMEWSGIVLVGGVVTGNGRNEISGGIVAGLNLKLGNAAAIALAMGGSDLGNGTKHILYNSCNIATALANFGGLATYPNTWSNNWASF